jgi:hypothetical protein
VAVTSNDNYNGNGNDRDCSNILRIAPCTRRAPNGPPGCNAIVDIAPLLVRAVVGTNRHLLGGRRGE